MKHYIIILILAASTLSASFVHAQNHTPMVEVSYQKTAMLVFPSSIIDADRGSEGISIRIARKAPTVLKVKASTPGFEPTNLTVYTEDGRMYMINVHYDSLAADTPYTFDAEKDAGRVTPGKEDRKTLTQQAIKDLAPTIAAGKRQFHHPSVKNGKVTLSLANIWVRDDYLFFRFILTNHSSIPYDLGLAKYYERDNTKGKRTSVVEKEKQPVYFYVSGGERTPSASSQSLVIVFAKFTLAEHKHLAVEMLEENGDRQLSLRIKGTKITSARPLL